MRLLVFLCLFPLLFHKLFRIGFLYYIVRCALVCCFYLIVHWTTKLVNFMNGKRFPSTELVSFLWQCLERNAKKNQENSDLKKLNEINRKERAKEIERVHMRFEKQPQEKETTAIATQVSKLKKIYTIFTYVFSAWSTCNWNRLAYPWYWLIRKISSFTSNVT